MSLRLAVFASGGGSNLQALLDHGADRPDAPARVALVVSDRPGAGALERAERAGVPTRVVPVRGRPDAEVSAETIQALEDAGVELVALAGYLRLVPAPVVRRWAGRMVNIHPALLPAFGGPGMYGARVHQAVLEAGCTVTGASVHLVDEVYDRGRILAQWPVPVLPGDTAERLAARVLRVEHRLYPLAVDALARRVAGGEAGMAPSLGEPTPRCFDLVEREGPGAAAVLALLGEPQGPSTGAEG